MLYTYWLPDLQVLVLLIALWKCCLRLSSRRTVYNAARFRVCENVHQSSAGCIWFECLLENCFEVQPLQNVECCTCDGSASMFWPQMSLIDRSRFHYSHHVDFQVVLFSNTRLRRHFWFKRGWFRFLHVPSGLRCAANEYAHAYRRKCPSSSHDILLSKILNVSLTSLLHSLPYFVLYLNLAGCVQSWWRAISEFNTSISNAPGHRVRWKQHQTARVFRRPTLVVTWCSEYRTSWLMGR